MNISAIFKEFFPKNKTCYILSLIYLVIKLRDFSHISTNATILSHFNLLGLLFSPMRSRFIPGLSQSKYHALKNYAACP